MIKQYNFHKTKYGDELLIDLIRLESLELYIKENPTYSLTYYDITLIVDGEGKFGIDDNKLPIERGSIFFTSPGQVRSWQFNDIPKGYALIFEEEFLCAFFNDPTFVQNLSYFNGSGISPALVLTSNEFNQLIPLMQNIQAEIGLYQNNDKHILRALLYQVLMLLNRIYLSHHPLSTKKITNRYIHEFIQSVNVNYRNYRSVDYYARQLHITSGHLNDLVKKHTGLNAKQHILNRTMLEAKRLLNYSTMTIDEIASHLNYESTTYFVRAFRNHTNMTPLHFRKNGNP